jgi:ribonuclease HI
LCGSYHKLKKYPHKLNPADLNNGDVTSLPKTIHLYSDGGSRGNPGPAAAAYLILTENNTILEAGACFLGKRTNNQAEYEALNAGLEAAVAFGAEEVVSHLDSELVCKHQTGEYQVKNSALLKLWKKTKELKRLFKRVRFVNVPRTNHFIVEADRLVNEALDKASCPV